MNDNKKLGLLIVLSTIARCVLAFVLELGNDEVYYVSYARHLQWNYFDHPPMVGLMIKLTTLGLSLHNELFVRGGSIACAAANTLLVYLAAKKIGGSKAGWYAALLYTSSFYCSIVAGTLILPDSPQVFFWMTSFYLMIKLIDDEPSSKQKWVFILLGISIGLCIMSKVHGIFLWIGFGMYILFYGRSMLWNPFLYVALSLTALIVSPILIWNLQNDFVNYSFHNHRVGFVHRHLDWDGFLQQLLGSIFYNNPINVVLYTVAVVQLFRKKVLDSKYVRLCLLMGLPLIIVLLIVSLFNETLPHWSGPAYISMLILTGAFFASAKRPALRVPFGIRAAVATIVFVAVVAPIAIKVIPVSLGNTKVDELGDGDVTLDMNGWRTFGKQFDSLYQSDQQNGLMQKDAFILSSKWFPAAGLEFYLADPMHLHLFVAGRLIDMHHYVWLNTYRPAPAKGADAYFIYPSNYFGPPEAPVLTYFEQVDSPVVIPQFRSGIHVRNFLIIRMHRYRGGFPHNGLIEATDSRLLKDFTAPAVHPG